MWQTSSPDVTNKLARCDEHITENKAESSNKPDGNFLDFDTQSEEVKTQQQSEISKPVFDFDLVLAWILTQFENSGWFTLDAMDKAFVSAKLEEYQQRYQKPNKGDALSFVDIAMRQRHGIERRSMKASAARDEVNNAVTRQLKAQAEVVEQHTRNMKPKSFEEKQADRTWANE